MHTINALALDERSLACWITPWLRYSGSGLCFYFFFLCCIGEFRVYDVALHIAAAIQQGMTMDMFVGWTEDLTNWGYKESVVLTQSFEYDHIQSYHVHFHQISTFLCPVLSPLRYKFEGLKVASTLYRVLMNNRNGTVCSRELNSMCQS
jgi:hypothetical protein